MKQVLRTVLTRLGKNVSYLQFSRSDEIIVNKQKLRLKERYGSGDEVRARSLLSISIGLR